MYVCMYVGACKARERERRDAHEEHGGDDERPGPAGRVQPDDRCHQQVPVNTSSGCFNNPRRFFVSSCT